MQQRLRTRRGHAHGALLAATTVGLALCLTLLAAGAPWKEGAEAATTEALIRLSFDAKDCGGCDGCFVDGEIGHFTWRNSRGFNDIGNEPHEDCHTGLCGDFHPVRLMKCAEGGGGDGPALAGGGGTDLTLPELWFAAVEASPGQLAQLVAAHPSNLHINSRRAALQFLGCEGQVIAQLPLNEATLATLTE